MIKINEELSFKETSKLIRDLYSALDTVDRNGIYSRRGDWYVGQGAYDLWYFINYKNNEIAEVTYPGKVSPVYNDSEFPKEFANEIAKLIANHWDYELSDEWY